MVQIIPRQQTFAEQIAPAFEDIGMGLGHMVGRHLTKQQQKQEQQLQQQKQLQALQLMGLDPSIANLPEQAQAAYFKSKFPVEKPLTSLQKSQEELNRAKMGQIESQQNLFNRYSGSDESHEMGSSPEESEFIQGRPIQELQSLAAFKGQPGQEGIIGNMAQAELDRRREEKAAKTHKESRYFELNEPKLGQIADTERKLNIENARYGRLEELFSDPSKFPSSLTAALFTKEGHLSDIAYSQLSPEAQEALKLIIDSTSNIKDTFGAIVTNFDIQTYLRKLPSLLNSPEGRTRVLRDLKSINEINQIYNRGIQDIFDEAGGTDKIPFSVAEKRFKKKYGDLLEKNLKDFATPEKKSFNEKPNAKQYLGKKIKDADTGEIFISDGVEWKPFGG